MKKMLFIFWFVGMVSTAYEQSVTDKLALAFQKFQNDSQLHSAMASIYVIEAKTGKVVFEKNSTIGLAPASTQKIITSMAAYELLGKNFRYQTSFLTDKKSTDDYGNILIKGSGDPTLGSWRWEHTREKKVLGRVAEAIKKSGIKSIGKITVDNKGWESEAIPDGWIWQDLGNYYGAAAQVLNWRENQFDVVLKSGASIGDSVRIVTTIPKLHTIGLSSLATTAAENSGDNTILYFPLNNFGGVIRGTIPANENRFKVSGSLPAADNEFIATLLDTLLENNIQQQLQGKAANSFSIFHTEYSPSLDSIIYWFLKKSINLYGEALIKTISLQHYKYASTDSGVVVIKNFGKSKGIDPVELNIVDGSGLSPVNRVTTHAQVMVLQYAKHQDWFKGFYEALPEYNGMKMKSGTIHAVKGFTGYHTSKNGVEYIFSFLINNYNGSTFSVVQKMYKVLDVLK